MRAPTKPGRPSQARPLDTDPAVAERVGRAALDKLGYEKILRLALEKGWIWYPPPRSGNALGQVAAAWPLFTRYAVTAGVVSQVDSPAPGPADVVAVGILVVGLVHAGLVAASIVNAAEDAPITGPTAAPPVPVARPTSTPAPTVIPITTAMATAAPTTTAPPIETTQEKEKRCKEERDHAFDTCKELLKSRNPPRGLTGGYRDLEKCMQGFISQDCGGNKVDEGPQRPRRKK